MPHVYLKDFKSNISAIATALLAEAEAYALRYALQKVQELIDDLLEQCPPPSVLKQINRSVDSVKKVKLGIEKKVETVKKQAEKLDKPIKVTKASIEVLSHFPVPSAVPPGVGLPVGVLNTYGNALEYLRGMVNALEDDKEGILSVTETAINTFNPVSVKLARIENLLNRCIENPNLTKEDRESILGISNRKTNTNNTLKELFESQSGGKYTLSIELDKEQKTITPKRRAIAVDENGVTILKGPFSYAGSPEILIEEIKFRINNQLP